MGALLNLLLCFYLVGDPSTDSVASEEPLGARQQAVLLYNLVRYVDWQSDETVIGIIGDKKITSELTGLAKTNTGVKVKQLDGVEEVSLCDMVFLDNGTNTQFYEAQQQIGTEPILLIVNNKALVVRGAEMGFYLEDERLRFVANNYAIEETGLKVSQKLMSKMSAY